MSRTEPGTLSGGPPTARAAHSEVVTTDSVAANRGVITTIRRAAVWALLLAKLTAGWGLGWDIRWHILIGRDSFWIPPHVLTYASVAAGVLIAFGVLAVETW